MKVYDDIVMVEDGAGDYVFKRSDGATGFGYAEVDEDDGSVFADFQGGTFTADSLRELIKKLRIYNNKTVKLEIPKEQLNEILGRGNTLDIYSKVDIRDKELVNISVKFGTGSQTLLTEWV